MANPTNISNDGPYDVVVVGAGVAGSIIALQLANAGKRVLMLEAGADSDLANFIPRYLTLESRSDFAALFRVQRDAPGCESQS